MPTSASARRPRRAETARAPRSTTASASHSPITAVIAPESTTPSPPVTSADDRPASGAPPASARRRRARSRSSRPRARHPTAPRGRGSRRTTARADPAASLRTRRRCRGTGAAPMPSPRRSRRRRRGGLGRGPVERTSSTVAGRSVAYQANFARLIAWRVRSYSWPRSDGVASETAQARRNAAARPRTTRARRSGCQPSRRLRSAAATSTQAIAASASVDVDRGRADPERDARLVRRVEEEERDGDCEDERLATPRRRRAPARSRPAGSPGGAARPSPGGL